MALPSLCCLMTARPHRPRSMPAPPPPKRRCTAPGVPPVPAPPERDCAKSALKRDFIRQARARTYEFEKKITLASDVSDAVRWIGERTPGAVRRAREEAVWRIETRARQLEQSGAIEAWYRGADEGVRGVAWYVNGPLLEELAASIGHIDRECVEFSVRRAHVPPLLAVTRPSRARGRPCWVTYRCRALARLPHFRKRSPPRIF